MTIGRCWLLLISSLAIVSLGCHPAPRGQWVWDVGNAGEYRASPQLAQKLSGKISVSFEDRHLYSVFDELSKTTGINFHVSWDALEAAAIERDAEVDLKLNDVPLTTVLDCLLQYLGGGETELSYHVKNDVVMVSTKEDLSRYTVIRIYDVSDMIVPGYLNTFVYYPESGGCFSPRKSSSWEYIQLQGAGMISRIVQELIDPESWRLSGGTVGTIDVHGDRLIICQTPEAHQQIEILLTALCAAMKHR